MFIIMAKKVKVTQKLDQENQVFLRARAALLETNSNLFITGRAGTGKSTLLEMVRGQIKANLVVLAPTGVAALNVEGETIHSFFKIFPGDTIEETAQKIPKFREETVTILKKLELIIIDEISMVRADLLDQVDLILRKVRRSEEAFGGVRFVFFGDLFQLPPVVTSSERKWIEENYETPYFFSSQVFRRILAGGGKGGAGFQFFELIKIYRQKDQEFIDFLDQVRFKNFEDQTFLERLNRQIVGDDLGSLTDQTVVLTTTRAKSQQINDEKLRLLPDVKHNFTAQVTGALKGSDYPTDLELTLKIGARVMVICNAPVTKDSKSNIPIRDYVNGTMGRVVGFVTVEEWLKEVGGEKEDGGGKLGAKDYFQSDRGEVGVIVLTDEGRRLVFYAHQWDKKEWAYDAVEGKLTNNTVGSFLQIPLKLAWAMTIHKSQGKTFDRVRIDLGKFCFAEGQTYVALSRCRTREGIELVREIRTNDVRVDYQVTKFVTGLSYETAHQEQTVEEIRGLLEMAIEEELSVKIVYLKGKGVQSERVIKPYEISIDEFNGHEYERLDAFCYKRQDDRNFNVERILSAEVVEG